jgi:hypothetical protein
VIHAVQHGMTDRETAVRRGISRDAVKFHLANVVAKLDRPNRKALRRWFRPPKGSALNRMERILTSPLKLGPIGQISRSVKDITAAEAWYGKVLGLVETAPPAESIIYFKVDDIQKGHDGLKAKGVESINAPHLIHRHADGAEEWMAFFKDPEGRPLALISQVK